MTAFISIGIGQSIFLAMLVLFKKDRKVFDYLLVAWLMVCAIQMHFFHLNFMGDTERFIPYLLTGGLLAYLTGPLLYFYVCALVLPKRFNLLRYSYHFFPFLFFAAHLFYYYYLGAEDQRVWIEEGYVHIEGPYPQYMYRYTLIMAFFSCLYPILSFYLLMKHKTRLEEEFSYTEKINLNWLKYWIVINFVGFWVSFIIIWVGIFKWITTIDSFKVVAGNMVVNVLVIGFFGLRQGSIFVSKQGGQREEPGEEPPQKYLSSSLLADDASRYASDVRMYMEIEKPYLNPKLTLEEMAKTLNIPKHHLSQVINEQFNLNFFDYVNGFRVEEFKQRIDDEAYQNLTLLGLALECGFNSKSSFNSIFKKREGITPSEFRKNRVVQ